MRVLMMTWEFPPFIAGGLGMACYGLARALLEMGVEIDLMLPTTEEVYFPLRKPDDVDTMPVEFLDPSRRNKINIFVKGDLRERLKALGLSEHPESYVSPCFNFEKALEWLKTVYYGGERGEIETIAMYIRGHENLFRKVQEFTTRAVKYAPTLGCDVIHAHDWLTYTAGVMLKNILGKPLVAHMHATEFDRAGGPGDRRIHDIEYFGLTNADLVAAVSKYTAQMVTDRYLVNPGKIRVVYNAYTVSDISEIKKEKIFKDPVVLFLGRVTLQKGPDYMIEVARQVMARNSRVRFVMAGNGDMFSKILRSSASKRLKDRLLFTGFLNREQVGRMLSAADIFVLPSVSEPFGIAPLEAMAYGAVAIISKQSGVSEVINNAFKVDFWDTDKTADIIIKLLDDPDERARIAEAGQTEVLAIGWKKAASTTRKIYEELVCST